MQNNFYILFFLFFQLQLLANQQKDSLGIKLIFNDKSIIIDENYISKNQDTLSFSTIKFYISDLEVNYLDNTKFKQKNSYHLIDISNPKSLRLNIDDSTEKEIKSIKFNIGIDSLANVSGALSGDLDLQNGMYWAWQSGYINMKIEGLSSSCKTRKNIFQFHIGGYLKPNYAMREIEIPIKKIQNLNTDLNLIVDFGKLFSEINLKEINSIMTPSHKAMKFADISSTIFSIE